MGGKEGSKRMTVRRETVVSQVDRDRGVFMISVAAELAEMHPQTLRMYEAKGLITPKRSPKNTRLFSQSDVERLRRIQRMTTEEGLNLAGVESVLELEDQLARLRREVEKFRRRADELERQMQEEIARARTALAGELVPYGAYDILEPIEGEASVTAKLGDADVEAADDPDRAADLDAAARPRPQGRPTRSGAGGKTVRIPVERPDSK